jgi:hypothetical protein
VDLATAYKGLDLVARRDGVEAAATYEQGSGRGAKVGCGARVGSLVITDKEGCCEYIAGASRVDFADGEACNVATAPVVPDGATMAATGQDNDGDVAAPEAYGLRIFHILSRNKDYIAVEPDIVGMNIARADAVAFEAAEPPLSAEANKAGLGKEKAHVGVDVTDHRA